MIFAVQATFTPRSLSCVITVNSLVVRDSQLSYPQHAKYLAYKYSTWNSSEILQSISKNTTEFESSQLFIVDF